MFIISFGGKKLKKRIAAGIILTAALVLIIVLSNLFITHIKTTKKINGRNLDLNLHNVEDAKRLAEEFGMNTENAEVKSTAVQIPQRFNDVFVQYNDLQKAFGTDLEAYKGRQCIKYTVSVYDDSDSGGNTATLLAYNGILIGGDMSENAFDGTVKGLADVL